MIASHISLYVNIVDEVMGSFPQLLLYFFMDFGIYTSVESEDLN